MLTLASGQPHPSATKAKLHIADHAIDVELEYDIRVFKRRLGIMLVSLYDALPNVLDTWDWFEGRKILVSYSSVSDRCLHHRWILAHRRPC